MKKKMPMFVMECVKESEGRGSRASPGRMWKDRFAVFEGWMAGMVCWARLIICGEESVQVIVGVRDGFWKRSSCARMPGPQALSWMCEVEETGGRRERRWVASWRVQPPEVTSYFEAKSENRLSIEGSEEVMFFVFVWWGVGG